ncbi:DUF2905 domain-containing protein [Burkholderiales bacterium]|nr:DUF2905 domain-containing protein [Burkholderiales bacterium]
MLKKRDIKSLYKWFFTIILVVAIVAYTKPVFLRFIGKLLGRRGMPGDITVYVFKRKLYLPFGSTFLFSLIATCLYWAIR